MDVEASEQQATVEQPEELPDLDEFTSYEDGEDFVVCGTKNPNAWIRSDVTRDLEV